MRLGEEKRNAEREGDGVNCNAGPIPEPAARLLPAYHLLSRNVMYQARNPFFSIGGLQVLLSPITPAALTHAGVCRHFTPYLVPRDFPGTTLLYNLETSELLVELKGNASPVKEVVFNQETSQLTTMCSRQAAVWDVSSATKVCGHGAGPGWLGS